MAFWVIIMFVLITVTKFQQFGNVMRMALKSSCEPRFNGAQLQPNVMASRTKTKRFFICRILYNDHSAPLCAMCSLSWAKILKKIRHSVCLRAFFLFEVYYCPMLFPKNLINVRNTLFSVFYIPEKIEILSQRGL